MSKRRVHGHWSDATLRKKVNPFRDVPVSTLHNYEMELRALIGACDKERARLMMIRDLVVEVQKERDGPDNTVIADHAIVRWLERYEGLDVSRVENAIAEMLDGGAKEVAIRDGIVITILPQGCEATDDTNYEGND